ncbi:AsmA family protein [Vibrio chemaguriensis]|uniref:AsmA family protein n=1 Tax=Vibrio chemaguriensis TaxID=2527672 RepID=UPI001CDD6AB6|nr:AsmA family protein [Vibrio chemaguriensis]MCA2415468.1 AsmA family protein [Vibrio chemaguriensis]MCA2426555.1 AsmA family protein [Vibrio chemaguriensis]
MKTARRVLILLLVILVAIPATMIALLTTSYADVTWRLLSNSLSLPFQAESVRYDFPYHLTLQGVNTNVDDASYIEQVDLWMNPDVYRDGKWIVDSLLIDGLNLQYGAPKLPPLDNVLFHQIALKNIDYADEQFSGNGIDLQIQSPLWNGQLIPYGEVQLAADQIYWNGEAFNQVLVDMDYKPQDSTLYGTSFNWRNSQISGQGEQYPQGWSLVNVTINKLQLNHIQLQSLLAKPWQAMPFQINHINSLDLLNADIEWGDWHWQNLELSVENATLPLSLWETTAQVSLQADSVRFQQQTAIEPRLSAVIEPGKIQLNDLSLDWQHGRVQVSGGFTPTQWQLEEASIQGLKWAIQPEDNQNWWHAAISKLDHVTIQRLEIERSQIIQLSHEPYWQFSGLNIEGQQLDLKQLGQRWGLWQGELEASVVNASYNQVLTSHAALAMQSENGFWQLTRLFAPLEQGYVEGIGQIDLSTPSQPWALNLNADGIPLSLFHDYLPNTLAIDGFSDLSLDLQGLSGDRNMLAYSLSGEVEANLRDTRFKSQANHSLKAITLSPLSLSAQRGKVAIEPVIISGKAMSGRVWGEFDMANNPLNGIVYQLKESCGSVEGDLLSGEIHHNECLKAPAPKAPADVESTPQTSESAMELPTAIDNINVEIQEEEFSEEIVEEDEASVTAPTTEEQILPPTERENETDKRPTDQ